MRQNSNNQRLTIVVIASLITTALSTGVGFTQAAYAADLPQNGSVVRGNATIDTTVPNHLNVNQTSDRAVINWDQFNIGNGNTATFNMPGANSAVLNRVTSTNPADYSRIDGVLKAGANGGRFILVNPHGIHIGSTGKVLNFNSFVATTADIDNDHFMNTARGAKDGWNFDKAGGATSSITNSGEITVADGGLVVLAAPGVVNSGTINAIGGAIDLISTQTQYVDIYGDGLIMVKATSIGFPLPDVKLSVKFHRDQNGNRTGQVTQLPVDVNGNPVTAAVENKGTLRTFNGTVGNIALASNVDPSLAAALPVVHTGDSIANGFVQENDLVPVDVGPGPNPTNPEKPHPAIPGAALDNQESRGAKVERPIFSLAYKLVGLLDQNQVVGPVTVSPSTVDLSLSATGGATVVTPTDTSTLSAAELGGLAPAAGGGAASDVSCGNSFLNNYDAISSNGEECE